MTLLPSIPRSAWLSLGVALTLAACFAPRVAWTAIPVAWFPIYVAMLLRSWLGSRVAGLISAALVALLVWVLMRDDPAHYLSASIIISTGVLFCVFHDRSTSTARGAG